MPMDEDAVKNINPDEMEDEEEKMELIKGDSEGRNQ